MAAASDIVLRMNVHCGRCALRIRKAIKSHYGAAVREVWASPEMGLVGVTGPYVDASDLKCRLQSKTGRRVDVVKPSPEEEDNNGKMVHLGPPQTGYGPYGYYYGGGWVPVVPQYSYGYGYGYGARQYLPYEATACFNDDNPNSCCVMQ
ncbi:unnamed protein product [Urochloa decumbens]|uniref:HMA domain-containing protein n=1 Tax=Urochloa decumbens TaxID=240449 RepID=A0ABC9H2M9_9POAL